MTWLPSSPSKRIMTDTSLIAGMFLNVTDSSVSRLAARHGKAAFLFPLILTVPLKADPP